MQWCYSSTLPISWTWVARVLQMQKERSVFESRFRLDRLGDLSEEEEDHLLMILLLERDRA